MCGIINDTRYLRGNPHGKNHRLVSAPHSNPESTNGKGDYNIIPVCNSPTLPNPGISEPSSIACDLSNLISEATQDLVLNEEIIKPI